MTVIGEHPAKYSKRLIDPICELLGGWTPTHGGKLYDPMAGTGEMLAVIADTLGVDFCGSEIEPEFIKDPRVIARDCRDYIGSHSLIACSPAYGNRMADQYLGTPEEQRLRAEEGVLPRRRSYAISLGRRTSVGSGAGLQWGDGYRDLHGDIIRHVVEHNMTADGVWLVNVTSHFRAKDYEPVAEWWLQTCLANGLSLVDFRFVETLGFRDGQNREDRVGGENLYLFRK